MIVGVGTDICAIQRIEETLAEFGDRFIERLLTPAERTQKTWDAPSLARRWALKEAVAKAVGTGIGGQVGFQQIEITYTPEGAPRCAVQDLLGDVWVSVSDDGGFASAFAVWEK